MKNKIYSNDVRGVCEYIADRNNSILVSVSIDTIQRKDGREGVTNPPVYKSFLHEFKHKPITYRVNIFPSEKKVRILLSEREYTLNLCYANNNKTFNTFSYKLPQKMFEIILDFESYQDKITTVDKVVDEAIEKLIENDLEEVIERGNVLDVYHKTWVLNGTIFSITFQNEYAMG